jgi:hypothetical protein
MGEFKLGFFWVLGVGPRGDTEEGGHYVCFCALGEFIFGQLVGFCGLLMYYRMTYNM